MPSTPPSSPTSGRDVARHLERSHRVMDSPENHRIPTGTLVPSTSRAPPSDFISQLSSIPSHHQHDLQASSSTSALAPPAIITSMAPPPLPSHRQTLSSAQLAAAYAALPPLNPTASSNITFLPPFAPPPHRQTSSTSQLAAAYAALPPFPSSSRSTSRGPPPNPQLRFRHHSVSIYIHFL